MRSSGLVLALNHRNQHSGKGQCHQRRAVRMGVRDDGEPAPQDPFGTVREPSGGALPGMRLNASCRGGKYVLMGGNGDGIFKRLMNVMGRDDLRERPALCAQRRARQGSRLLDAAIEEWTKQHDVSEFWEQLNAAGVPVGYPYTAADIVADPHYQAREMIQTIDLPSGKTLKVPAVLPKLSETPGQIGGAGPAPGRAYGRGALGNRH